MPTIVDSLVVLLKLDAAPLKKGADEAAKAIESVKQKTKISDEDAERIAASQEQRRKERAATTEKAAKQKASADKERRAADEKAAKDKAGKQKQRDLDRKKSVTELTDTLKTAAGVAIGFETVKGLVGYLAGISGAAAALGRDSANLGVSAEGLQTWGNAIARAGGQAEDAKASFMAVSQAMTAFQLKHEIGPLLQLAQQGGISPFNADGTAKDATTLIPQIYDALKARGLSRPNIANLLGGAGINEGTLNLLADPNRAAYLAAGAQNTYTAEARKRGADLAAKRAALKQGFNKFSSDAIDTVTEHPVATFLDPTINPFTRGMYDLARSGMTDLYELAFGTKGATKGIRNNNPGNIENRDGSFKQFTSMLAGETAIESDVDVKINKDHLDTVRKIISKYAPPKKADGSFENDTEAYIRDVVKRTGFGENDHLTSNGATRYALAQAIMAHENAGVPGAMNQIRRAVATPGATTTNNGGATTNVTIGTQTINTQAKDGQGVAVDFMGSVAKLTAQSNRGMTP